MALVNTEKQTHSSKCSAREDRLQFEQFMADLSARFVALSPDRVHDEIGNALREVLEFFPIDRFSLLRLLPDKTLWQVTHNADAAGTSPYPVGVSLPVSLVPWAHGKLAEQREVISFAGLEELPAEAATDKVTLEEWKVRSGLYIPIAALKSSEYTIGISSAENDRICPEEYIPRLRLLGELFVNALERSRGELALRESEERLNLAVSAAEAGLWIMYVDRDLIWSTQKFRELFQFDLEEELHFERFLSAIHPDDRERIRVKVRQSLEKREALNLEYRIVQPDGSLRWIYRAGTHLSMDRSSRDG